MATKVIGSLCAFLLASGANLTPNTLAESYGELLDLWLRTPRRTESLPSLLHAPFDLPGSTSSAEEAFVEAMAALQLFQEKDLANNPLTIELIRAQILNRLNSQWENRDRLEEERENRSLVGPLLLTGFASYPGTGTFVGNHLLVVKKEAIEVWDVKNRALVKSIPWTGPRPIQWVTFSEDGQMIILFAHSSGASPNSKIRTYDLRADLWTALSIIPPDKPDYLISPVVRGDQLATVNKFRSTVHLWDWKQDKEVGSFRKQTEYGIMYSSSLAFHPTNPNQIAFGQDCNDPPTLVDLTTGNSIPLPTLGHTLHSLAYSRDGTVLVGGASGANLYIWNTVDASAILPAADFTGDITHVAFSPEGDFLFAADRKGIHQLETKTWTRTSFRRYQQPSNFSLSTSGEYLAVFNEARKEVEVWRLDQIPYQWEVK